MNYYERHLGDYARDTGHLTMLEHGAYTLLLDRYYASEDGIPAEQVHRLARARTDDEKAAVDAVLGEFFHLDGGIWIHHRAEREIAKFTEKHLEREAERQNETDRKRRYRERRAQLFDQLRELGIVPAFDTATDELVRMLSRGTSEGQDAGRDAGRPRTGTANQTPDTSNQTPDKSVKPRAPRAVRTQPSREQVELPDWVDREAWGEWAQHRSEIGYPLTKLSGQKAVDQLKTGTAQGYTQQEIVDNAINSQWRGLYLPKVPPLARQQAPPARVNGHSATSKTLSAIQTLQGMKHGNLAERRDSGRSEQAALLESGAYPGE